MCHGKAYHHKWGHHPRHHFAKKGKHFRHRHPFWNTPPANVQELDDRYELFIYAAGYAKGDFEVQLRDDLLIVTAANKEGELVESGNWRRREFRASGFERYFELNEKIDREAISAKYEEGILKVTLPKLAGMETQSQDVIVA